MSWSSDTSFPSFLDLPSIGNVVVLELLDERLAQVPKGARGNNLAQGIQVAVHLGIGQGLQLLLGERRFLDPALLGNFQILN